MKRTEATTDMGFYRFHGNASEKPVQGCSQFSPEEPQTEQDYEDLIHLLGGETLRLHIQSQDQLSLHFISSGLASTMRLGHGRRASLAITLNFVALAFAISAVTTSYWCEGTKKVAKPFCTGPPVKIKQKFCISFNSSNLNDSRQVLYIFETGEEKFLLKKFHAGIFFTCEQATDMSGRCSGTGSCKIINL